jgi:hypothetical protein
MGRTLFSGTAPVTPRGAHLGHGLREALLREAAAAGPPERAPG